MVSVHLDDLRDTVVTGAVGDDIIFQVFIRDLDRLPSPSYA